MIDNEYVYELNLDIDYSALTRIVIEARIVDSLKRHQRNVSDFEYTQLMWNRYPILSKLWNVYTHQPGTGMPPHIDAGRMVTLNIPIKGSEGSVTTFYKDVKLPSTFIDHRMFYTIDDVSLLEETFHYTLARPTLIKTTVPHSVVAGDNTRTIISWSIPELTFEQAKDYFKSMSVL